MHIPEHIRVAVTEQSRGRVTVTERVSVTVPVRHHDVSSQLGEECTHEFYGYDESINLSALRSAAS